MELISLFLYNKIPFELNHINVSTHHRLKQEGWYNDTRSNKKFSMFNKRMEIEGKWFRVLLRFEYAGVNAQGIDMFNLSIPCPFIITQCEPMVSGSETRWKDIKSYHGPKLGMTGYLQERIPTGVFDEVIKDIKACVNYN